MNVEVFIHINVSLNYVSSCLCLLSEVGGYEGTPLKVCAKD